MPTVKDLTKWLQEFYDPDELIAWSIWTGSDVWMLGDEQDIDLTDEEIERVLEWANQKQDASQGINWDVLGFYVDEVIRERNENQTSKENRSSEEIGREDDILG